MALAVAEAARRRRPADRPPPRRLPPRRAPRASATPTSRASSRASTRCASGPTGATGVSVGVAAHSVRAVPPDWLEAIAAYADDHGLVRHVHAHEQPRELARVPRRARRQPDRAAARAPASSARARASCTPSTSTSATSRCWPTSETIVVTCPTTEGNLGDGHLPALAYRDAGVRLAIGTDSQVRVDPFEETRELETGARREGRTRHALLAHHGDLWAELARNGLASLGLEDGGTIDVDLDHPDLRGVGGRRPGARARDVRLGRRRRRQASRVRAGGGSLS